MKQFHKMQAWYTGDSHAGEFYSYNTMILRWDNYKNITVGRCVGISPTTMRQTTRFLRETFGLDLSPKVLRCIAHGDFVSWCDGKIVTAYDGTNYCLLSAPQGSMQFNSAHGNTPCKTNYVS